VLLSSEVFPGPDSLARLSGRVGLVPFAGLVLVGVVTDVGHDPARAVLGGLVAVAPAVLLFLVRPRFFLGYAALSTAGVVLLGNADSRSIVWFALVVLAAWCVVSAGVVVGIACWLGIALVFGGEWLWAVRDPGWAPWTAGVTVSVLASLLIRHEFLLVERLRAAQADLAERTRAEERNRIARELHDVIAHSLTISLLHVTSARLAVEHEPADAARALAEAERLGRQSLDEVRSIMGFLRPELSDGPAAPPPPVPVLDQLPRLVEQLRAAGADVSLSVEGDLATPLATTGSTVYRIVQEALTNATKHAPGSAARVRVAVTGVGVELRVDSAGLPGHGSGMGLENMVERARAIGGTCHAGPGGSGWLVEATLPRQPGRSSEAR
jgi:signal transduction histidine kinase